MLERRDLELMLRFPHVNKHTDNVYYLLYFI